MKTALVAVVVALLAAGAALGETVVFQDGDFTNVGTPATAGGVYAYGFDQMNVWLHNTMFGVVPTDGNPDAWWQHWMFSEVAVLIPLPAPVEAETWTVSFDYILQGPSYHSRFSVQAIDATEAVPNPTYAYWAGAGTDIQAGTRIFYQSPVGNDAVWTNKSYDVDVPAGNDVVLLVWRIGSDADYTLNLRGIDNVKVVVKEATAVPGDANGDGVCDVGDLGILGANYNTAVTGGISQADFNEDGMVDVGDLGILGANYTSAAPVPEPATLSLLGLGVLALRRRR